MRLLLTILLGVCCISAQTPQYTAFGDSITDTGAACGDASSGSACYADLVAAKEGWPLDNQGIGGSQAADQSEAIYRTSIPATGAQRFSYMIGTNDAWGYGTNADKQANYQAIDLADLAYLAIPDTHKIKANDPRVAYSGYGWYQGSPYGSGTQAVFCGNPGATAAISLTGTAIYLSLGMQDGNGGSFSVSVDGQPVGMYAAAGKNGSAIRTVVYGTTVAPQLIRIPVAAGTHTVIITVLGPTIWFDWAATNAGVDLVNGPLVIAGGPPLQRTDDGKGGYPATELQQYAAMVQANVKQLAGDGLNVRYADTTDAFAGQVDQAITNPYDDVHPNDYGHTLLAAAFESAFGAPALSGGPLASGTYQIRNAYSGMYMDDPAFSVTSGTQIIQWWGNSQVNQHWIFDNVPGTSFYTIANLYSGLFLMDNGGRLVETLQSGTDSQLWSLRAVGPAYVLTNKATGRVMDDANWSVAAGNGLITWAANGGGNQSWTIQ